MFEAILISLLIGGVVGAIWGTLDGKEAKRKNVGVGIKKGTAKNGKDGVGNEIKTALIAMRKTACCIFLMMLLSLGSCVEKSRNGASNDFERPQMRLLESGFCRKRII